jgi:hypothetical protein
MSLFQFYSLVSKPPVSYDADKAFRSRSFPQAGWIRSELEHLTAIFCLITDTLLSPWS